MNTKLIKVLYRSLLRWPRQKDVWRVPFTIDTIKIENLNLMLPMLSKIYNARGVLAAVRYCFRIPKPQIDHKSSVNIAFGALKYLNSLTKELRDRLVVHDESYKLESLAFINFRIGEVVVHIEKGYRGVITGWSIDKETSVQTLDLLVDYFDAKRLSETDSTLVPIRVLSTDVAHVVDEALLRVYHNSLSSFFYCFDRNNGRFLPNVTLQFLYPNDYIPKNSIQEKLSLFLKVDSFSAGAVETQNHDNELALSQRCEKIVKFSTSIAISLKEILRNHGIVYAGYSEGVAIPKVGNPYFDEVLDGLLVLIEESSHIRTAEDFATPQDLISTSESDKKYKFHKSLLNSLLDLNGNNDDHEYMLAQYGVYTAMTRSRGESDSSAACRAVERIGAMYALIDQLLQLRFQNKGLSFFETLIPHMSFGVADPVSVKLAMERNDIPNSKFAVGQIVRHKKFKYRAVVHGYEHRPSQDCRRWDGVLGLKLGQEQRFYSVIPNQQDVELFLGGEQWVYSRVVLRSVLG